MRAQTTRRDNGPTRACLTLDPTTLQILDELQHSMRTSRLEAARTIIDSVREGEIKVPKLADFYRDTWVLVPSRGRKTMMRFNWSVGHDDTLHALGMEVLGEDNKSAVFRLLVAYYGISVGKVRIAWTRAAELKIKESKR